MAPSPWSRAGSSWSRPARPPIAVWSAYRSGKAVQAERDRADSAEAVTKAVRHDKAVVAAQSAKLAKTDRAEIRRLHGIADRLSRKPAVKPLCPSTVYDEPTLEERFYARALGILARPARRLAIAARVGNLLFAGVMLAAAAFASEQLWDRGDPVRFLSVAAQPDHVQAGDSVRVDLAVERYKRCDYAIEWDILDASREVWHFRGSPERAPGAPGLDRYMHRYATSRGLAPGPATLIVSLQATCPGNVLQRYWPLSLDMPPVDFTVDAEPSPLHDAAPVPDGDR